MLEVLWLRYDLRFLDHLVWRQWADRFARGETFQVACVWLETPSTRRAGSFRRAMIDGALVEIQKRLRAYGGELWTSHSRPEVFFGELARAHPELSTVWVTHEPAFEEQAQVQAVEQVLASLSSSSIPELKILRQNELLEMEQLPFQVTAIPEVFTEFRKQVEKTWAREHSLIREATTWSDTELKGFQFAPLPATPVSDTFAPRKCRTPGAGESAALARVKEYFWDQDRLRVYKETRNGMLDWNDSSKFSPALSLGALSPRVILNEIQRYEQERIKNDSTYWLFFELLWREYFRWICEKKGAAFFKTHDHAESSDESGSARELFEKWKSGTTGQPFIDANMRELAQTGWMSNRGRQNVASYLAKTMGLPWQWGAAYFEEQLLDYDVYSNWGNWAYLAGVGQDPRDRVFNPERQAQMYDPDGRYVARWLK